MISCNMFHFVEVATEHAQLEEPCAISLKSVLAGTSELYSQSDSHDINNGESNTSKWGMFSLVDLHVDLYDFTN